MMDLCTNKINDFILRVFNFYNGRINICNRARLQIEWINNHTSVAGSTKNPNVVIIYPLVIEKYSDSEYKFYYIILETIIHELHHIDQVINYPLMVCDTNYLARIECAVEEQTAIYIANNKQEIFENFGINIDYINSTILNNINKYAGFSYNRRRYIDHLIIILREIDALSSSKELCNYICNFNEYKRIIININGSTIDRYDDISLTNQFFYDNYFKYSLFQNVNMVFNECNNELYITITFTPGYNMVKLKKI